jgi:excinuclease ABC subunit C
MNYKTLPLLPGIYIFKDTHNNVIYIGKAKILRERVASYFTNTSDWKVDALLKEAKNLEHVVTKSELEALLLEAQLIQEHKPKFNVLLKNGNPFLYLLITNDTLPELKIVRTQKEKGEYFGPFIHKSQARSAYLFLVQTFQLFRCNKKITNGCLDYHIGRCIGTCMSESKNTDYMFRLELVRNLLHDNYSEFLKTIQKQIESYNKIFEFEKARNLQSYKENIDTIFSTLKAKFSAEKYLHTITTALSSTHLPSDYEEAAYELQNLLQLPSIPQTIDCFDISHFQSQNIVGSCIRYLHGKPDKKNFRRFKVKTLESQNDYAALQEIVSRRYRNPADLPDLILIDGGKGQRNAVKELLPEGRCISLAKREETLFTDNHPEGIILDIKTPIGKLIIALRDYAHHFCITYNRSLRKI